MTHLTSIDILGRWSSNAVRDERTSSLLINRNHLVECGPHSVEAMLNRNLDPLLVDSIAITHMHLDHYVGLAEFLWYRAIYAPGLMVSVLGPRGIGENTMALLKNVKTPESFDINVEFHEDSEFGEITPFRANHVIEDNGYRMEFSNSVLFYSGDTAYSENVVEGAENADFLFHEMTYTDDKRDEAGFWKHSTYSDTIRTFSESHAKKLVPVHLTLHTLDLATRISRTDRNILLPIDGEFSF
ncbi:MAG: MBL fold metallo-hydrolase [Thermoplasmataceae archaeon]